MMAPRPRQERPAACRKGPENAKKAPLRLKRRRGGRDDETCDAAACRRIAQVATPIGKFCARHDELRLRHAYREAVKAWKAEGEPKDFRYEVS